MKDISKCKSNLCDVIKQILLTSDEKFKAITLLENLYIATAIAKEIFGENTKSEDVFSVYDRLTKAEPSQEQEEVEIKALN